MKGGGKRRLYGMDQVTIDAKVAKPILAIRTTCVPSIGAFFLLFKSMKPRQQGGREFVKTLTEIPRGLDLEIARFLRGQEVEQGGPIVTGSPSEVS